MKRKTALITLVSLCAALVPQVSYAEEDYAQIFFGGGGVNINIEDLLFSEGSPIYEERDGASVLKLRGGSAVYADIDINDDLFPSFENGSYAVTVRYYDEGKGWFTIRYEDEETDPKSDVWREADRAVMQDTKTWKEHTFYLDQCLLNNNNAQKSDLMISSYARRYGGFTPDPVLIKSVKIEKSLPYDPIILNVTSANVGNIFRADDEKELIPVIKNIMKYPIDCELSYRFLTHSGNDLGGEGKLEFDLGGFETKQTEAIKVPDNITRYGTYDIEVSVNVHGNIEGKEYNKTVEPVQYDFSIMNKQNEGEASNRIIKTNSHIGSKYGDPDIALKLTREAGLSGIRDELRWEVAEKRKGGYTYPEPARDWVPKAKQYDLDRMWILDYGNLLYEDNIKAFPDDSLFPGSETAFLNYVDWISKTFKGEIEYYQLWNEPDVKGFNFHRSSAEQYTKMLKKVHDVVKKNDPNGEVVGFGVSRYGINYVRDAVACRAADYMDAASFHPYQFSGKFSGAVFKEKVQEMHDAFASVGKPDMPLYVTEMGIAAYPEGGLWPDEYGAAAQNIQLWTITEAEQLVDSLYAFHFINPIPATLWENAASQENRWGFINHENERVPYSARPAGIAAAAFNKLVCNAEMKNKYINTVDDEGHETYVYHLKRESDGKDVLVYWTEYGSETLGIKLGTDHAESFDLYSNSEGQLNATNGVFTLTTSYEPTYLVGDFSDFEITEPVIMTNGGRAAAYYNDTIDISYSDFAGRTLRADVTADDALEISSNEGITNGEGKLSVIAGKNMDDEEGMTVKLYDNDGNMVYYGKYHVIRNSSEINITAFVTPYNETAQMRQTLNLTVGNTTKTCDLTGSMIVDLSAIGGEKQKRTLVALKPGQSTTLQYNMPISKTEYIMELPLEYSFDGMQEEEKTIKLIPHPECAYAKTPPPIHGKYSRDDWSGGSWFKADDYIGAHRYAVWEGPKDVSVTAKMMWDETNLYLVAEVSDDTFYNPYDGEYSWQGDGIQIGIANEELIKTMSADKGEEYTYTDITMYHAPDGTNKIYRNSAQFSDLSTYCFIDGELSFEKYGSKWIYRAAVPWKEILGENRPVKEGDDLRMGLLANDNDGDGRYYMEFCEGIAHDKAYPGFCRLHLMGNK